MLYTKLRSIQSKCLIIAGNNNYKIKNDFEGPAPLSSSLEQLHPLRSAGLLGIELLGRKIPENLVTMKSVYHLYFSLMMIVSPQLPLPLVILFQKLSFVLVSGTWLEGPLLCYTWTV